MPFLGSGLKKLGGLGSSGVTWANYVTNTIAPAGWWRFRDSATPAVNAGFIGSALNLTGASVTFAQAGALGAGEAVSLDGANSRLQCANDATLAGYTTWEYVFLVNPSSAGEATFGTFFRWGNGNSDQSPEFAFNAATTAFFVRVFNSGPTAFLTTTTSGISTSAWSLVFVAFDDAGDRKVHIRVGVSGAVNEVSYSAQPAMTGTYKVPSVAFNLFNNSAQTATFAGLGDEVLIVNRNLSSAERLRLTQLAGLTSP